MTPAAARPGLHHGLRPSSSGGSAARPLRPGRRPEGDPQSSSSARAQSGQRATRVSHPAASTSQLTRQTPPSSGLAAAGVAGQQVVLGLRRLDLEALHERDPGTAGLLRQELPRRGHHLVTALDATASSPSARRSTISSTCGVLDDQRRRERDPVPQPAREQPGPARPGPELRRGRAEVVDALRVERDRGHQPDPAAHLADERMRLERPQRGVEAALERDSPVDEPVALEQRDVRERRRAAGRVAAVGRAVGERLPPRRPERLRDTRGDDDATERQVPAGHALREDDQVGREPEALDRVPAADPTEPADHRVGDREHAVAGADRGDLVEVPGRRGEHAARADHGLEDERRDLRGAEPQDLSLEGCGVVPRHARRVRDELAEALAVGHPEDARRDPVRPVVAVLAADQVRAGALAARRVPEARELRGRVDRVGAAAREEDLRARRRARARTAARRARARDGSRRRRTRGRPRAGRSCSAIASAISRRPWPTLQYQRLAAPSR